MRIGADKKKNTYYYTVLAPPVDSYGLLSAHKAAEREVRERGALSQISRFLPAEYTERLRLHGRQRAAATTTTCAVRASIPHTFHIVSVVPDPYRPGRGEYNHSTGGASVCARVFLSPPAYDRQDNREPRHNSPPPPPPARFPGLG